MQTITYRIVRLRSPINGIYHFRIDRITEESGKPTHTEEYQLCQTLAEATDAVEKLNAKK